MAASMLSVLNDLKAKVASLEAMITAATGVVEGVTAVTKKRGRPSKAAAALAVAAPAKPKKEMSVGMKAWHDFNMRIDTLLKANGVPFKRVAEAKQFASKLKKEKALTEWTDEEILAAQTKWAEEHKPTGVEDTAKEEKVTRPPGRPKMTDEQKAAKKAERDAAKTTTDTVTVVSEEVAPAAPKKPVRKLAWAPEEETRNLLDELESVAST
jgi:hypothetical protein